MTCLRCRERHVKCDGTSPSCGRCSQLRLQCFYVPSRRGRRSQFNAAGASASTSDAAAPSLLPESWNLSSDYFPSPLPSLEILAGWTGPQGSLPLLSQTESLNIDSSAAVETLSNQGEQINVQRSSWQPPCPAEGVEFSVCEKSRMLRLYFSTFHGSHPILPPLASLLRLNPPEYLLATMELAALHYLMPRPSKEQMAGLGASIVKSANTLHKAQALLILSILMHATGEPSLARFFLTETVQVALDINLHSRHFGENGLNCGGDNSRSGNVYIESARRTWWELFILDGLLAVFQQDGKLVISIMAPEVLLPCENELYTEAASVLSGYSLHDMQSRIFASDFCDYSSFAYRIEAAILLRDTHAQIHENLVLKSAEYQVLDARVATWFGSLPSQKQDIVRLDGTVDSMMFQAHLIAHLTGVLLNLRYSYQLSPLASMNRVLCGSGDLSSTDSPGRSHTAKALKAANSISELACLPAPVNEHTPFFTCFLVVSSVIHLAAWSFVNAEIGIKHRHFLSLNMTILRSLGKLWPKALHANDRIQEAAQEIFITQGLIDYSSTN